MPIILVSEDLTEIVIGGYHMEKTLLLPFIFALCTIILIVINILALMRLIPYLITLPLLFISIYLTFFTFAYRKVYRGKRNY